MNNPDGYRAGFCNIGEREIRLRKRLLAVSATVALFLSCFCLFYKDLLLVRLVTFFTAAVSFLVILEVRNRFCVLFGIFNLYNFGKLGELRAIDCTESCRKDRLTALRMIMFSFLYAALYMLFILAICAYAGL
jgi:hypothetical protein